VSAVTPTRVELLELDVDTRLADLWRLADQVEDWTLGRVAEFLRPAFVAGYMEAAQGDRSLFTDHGYAVPVAR
jgi:hypothetical protein